MIWLGMLLGFLAREILRVLFAVMPAPADDDDPRIPVATTVQRAGRDVPADITVAISRDRSSTRWN